MNIVDSSGWLEYFADGSNAAVFAVPILESNQLIVPSICIYEVYKQMERQKGRGMANSAVATMRAGRVIDLDKDLAVFAARLSLEEKLPMADSIILATARSHAANLWTQDSDLEGHAGVRYIRKRPAIRERRSRFNEARPTEAPSRPGRARKGVTRRLTPEAT